jgi:biopolymer transport protein ExbD
LEQQLFNKESKVIFIQADQSLNYGYVIRVMDIAKKAGVERVGLITEPPNRKKRRQ